MTAETAWKVAREAAAGVASAQSRTSNGNSKVALTPENRETHQYVSYVSHRISSAIETLPMPPAFAAAVEAEMEEVVEMLRGLLKHIDGEKFCRCEYPDGPLDMVDQGAEVEAARALLSRMEGKR